MTNKYHRTLSDATLSQLVQELFAPFQEAGVETFAWAGIAPLADVSIKVYSDDSDSFESFFVFQPVSGPAVGIVLRLFHLVMLSPCIENSSKKAMKQYNVNLMMISYSIIGIGQVNAWSIGDMASKFLIQIWFL